MKLKRIIKSVTYTLNVHNQENKNKSRILYKNECILILSHPFEWGNFPRTNS